MDLDDRPGIDRDLVPGFMPIRIVGMGRMRHVGRDHK
ncbi:Uncharacterised protein [Mycobacteroides abscessus subsp. abscessus]|nr:Uncharacterised protein [Mycobacteroides abscessus subsp. abscessus]